MERFASGKVANNKLEMPEALRYQPSRRLLIGRMGQVIVDHGVRLLWSIPTGGDDYADALTKEFGLEAPIRLRKVSAEPGRKVFAYNTPQDEARVLAGDKLIGVEDLTTELTSTDGALQVPGLRERTIGMVAAWRRGSPEQERDVHMPYEYAVEAPVPNIITTDHPFWQRWGHLAVGDRSVVRHSAP
jgi:hypothetical protein